MHSNPALRVVDRPQPLAFGPRHDEPVRPRAITEPSPPQNPAEQLWAEHGWGLNAQHVAILLIAVVVVSVCLRLLN